MVESEEKPQIVISVRNLVEFLLKEGSIDEGSGKRFSMEAMQEGSRLHRRLQKRGGSFYHAEYPLKGKVSYEEYDLVLEGRADGILFDDEALRKHDEAPEHEVEVTVDEIKGMYLDVMKLKEPIAVHLAQAKCYAFLFASDHHLPVIHLRMTYGNLDTKETRCFSFRETYETLQDWFEGLLASFVRWSDYLYRQRKRRQASIKGLEFPFPYRPGQKKVVGYVYRSMMQGRLLFLQAPTGTGKTLATIYPAIQAMGQGTGDKIFYLTAKTAAAGVARDTFALLEEKGYQGKTLMITAKDKICLLPERACNPKDCPYAAGYFDRVNDAVYELLTKKNLFDRDELEEAAMDAMLCPFELSLDLSFWVDHIICDYNYVFDPNVYLKRFFAQGQPGEYLFLIDEAHNMVDRAREMYSEVLIKEEFLRVKRLLKPFGKKTERALENCNRKLLALKRECGEVLMLEEIDEVQFALYRLAGALEELLQRDVTIPNRDAVLELYFKVRNFISLSEGMDEHYRLYCDYNEKGEFLLHLFCVDPCLLLQERLDRAVAAVYFSATLLPIHYYKSLLCNDCDAYAIYAQSVFSRSQRALVVGKDVSSKYTRRNAAEYQRFASYIQKIVAQRQGNYMVFCPSYRMMDEIFRQFLLQTGSVYDVICQSAGMTEQEREDFLKEFEWERSQSLVAFCVLGGIFSEGIDLTREKLIGAIVVGVGLPQIDHDREVIRSYFTSIGRDGFAFAYLYPGMNKVIQAAGRVIRTTKDRGVIALLDERFVMGSYQMTFPREWDDCRICNINEMEAVLKRFWEETGQPD